MLVLLIEFYQSNYNQVTMIWNIIEASQNNIIIIIIHNVMISKSNFIEWTKLNINDFLVISFLSDQITILLLLFFYIHKTNGLQLNTWEY